MRTLLLYKTDKCFLGIQNIEFVKYLFKILIQKLICGKIIRIDISFIKYLIPDLLKNSVYGNQSKELAKINFEDIN